MIAIPGSFYLAEHCPPYCCPRHVLVFLCDQRSLYNVDNPYKKYQEIWTHSRNIFFGVRFPVGQFPHPNAHTAIQTVVPA